MPTPTPADLHLPDNRLTRVVAAFDEQRDTYPSIEVLEATYQEVLGCSVSEATTAAAALSVLLELHTGKPMDEIRELWDIIRTSMLAGGLAALGRMP